jgi:hypothetical protein
VAVIGHLVSPLAALELTEALRRVVPGLAILLAAGSADEFGANGLVVAGISDVVPWPITAAEIATPLRDCLRRRGSQGECGFQPLGASYSR